MLISYEFLNKEAKYKPTLFVGNEDGSMEEVVIVPKVDSDRKGMEIKMIVRREYKMHGDREELLDQLKSIWKSNYPTKFKAEKEERDEDAQAGESIQIVEIGEELCKTEIYFDQDLFRGNCKVEKCLVPSTYSMMVEIDTSKWCPMRGFIKNLFLKISTVTHEDAKTGKAHYCEGMMQIKNPGKNQVSKHVKHVHVDKKDLPKLQMVSTFSSVYSKPGTEIFVKEGEGFKKVFEIAN